MAATFYFGVAPFFIRARGVAEDDFLFLHHRQALATVAMLAVVVFVFVTVVLFLTLGILLGIELIALLPFEAWMLDLSWKLFLCWVVVWVYAAVTALTGSRVPMPLAGRLARRPRLVRVTAWAMLGVYAFIAVAVPVTVVADRAVVHSPEPAEVYFLYDDLDRFPRWLFSVGFYPITRAANAAWGPGSVAVLPIDTGTIALALEHGRFAFLGSHGLAQGLYIGDRWVKPEDVAAMPQGDNMQFVYLAGCESGAQRAAWEQALAPAEVVTFDRLSAVVEHIAWMIFKGPGVVRDLTRG